MVKLKITGTGNAAFGESEYEFRVEVARIMRKAANDIEEGRSNGLCMDLCRNSVGEWTLGKIPNHRKAR
jgi:hypothetical protein